MRAMETIQHTPIMVSEIITHVPTDCHLYVDGTAGHGWHIAAIAASGKLAPNASIIAIDRDAAMLEKAKTFVWSTHTQTFQFVQDSYANIETILDGKKADFILLDIGVNMEHFKDGARGFSIHDDAPLDMRFDTRSWETAADILNTYSKDKLVDLFIKYGDFSPKSSEYFADHIIAHRHTTPFTTTKQFVESLYSIGVRKNQLPIIFQCLRIQTNQELAQLEVFLQTLPNLLSIGGRCAIITFHSTEDRIAKYAFKWLAEEWSFTLVNKKVIAPHYKEVQKNRAARSAKLRIIERVS